MLESFRQMQLGFDIEVSLAKQHCMCCGHLGKGKTS